LSEQCSETSKSRWSDNSAARLAAIVESSNDALVSKDLRGIITSWNQAAEAMFGYGADESIGQPITIIVPPDRLDEEASILEKLRRGERLVHFETMRQRKGGMLIPVSLTMSPIRDEQGRIIGFSKISRDLTETQRMRQELQRRETLLLSILDTVPDALVIIDECGLIQSFSAAAGRLFGFSNEEVLGRSVRMLIPSPFRKAHDGYLVRYLRRTVGIGRVLVGQRKEGSSFPMELSVGEVDLPGLRLLACFARDLTEHHDRERRVSQLQSELVHVARLTDLGQMVSALAHEVNQPVTAICNYLTGIGQLLATGDQERALQVMERVLQQAERARQIIQRLRDHVQKGETKKRIESLPETIEEATALALVGAGQDIKLEIRAEDDAAEAFIDKVQIQQVLHNLVRNALEAMMGLPNR
jgi:two-component system sensor kinase FixL